MTSPALRLLATLAVISSALVNVSCPARGAERGVAYDIVMYVGPDAAQREPGRFEADFQAALSHVPMASSTSAKTPTKFATAEGGRAGFPGGAVVRYYAAGSRVRIDLPSLRRVLLADCSARTFTTLDESTKTYLVVALKSLPDRTSPPNRLLRVENEALGKKVIFGVQSDGFRSVVSGRVMMPDHKRFTSGYVVTAYFSETPVAWPHCARVGIPTSAMGPDPTAATETPGNPYERTRDGYIKRTGVSLPQGRVPLFVTMTYLNPSALSARKFGMMMESGHIRSIQSDDPIFSVPSDYTKKSN